MIVVRSGSHVPTATATRSASADCAASSETAVLSLAFGLPATVEDS